MVNDRGITCCVATGQANNSLGSCEILIERKEIVKRVT